MAKELREGMLVLEPPRVSKNRISGEEFTLRSNIWAVKRVNKKSAVIIRADDSCQVEATTKGVEMPKGWSEINNAALAQKLYAFREAHKDFPIAD